MSPRECSTCEQTHERCKAHVDGRPCRLRPMRGQAVCGKHGGRAPAAKAKAAKRLAQQAAEKELARFGVYKPVDPGQALLEEVWRSAALVALYESKVAVMDEDDLVWGKTREKFGGDDGGTTYEAKPNVWLALLNDERDRLTARCVAALKAGIEERRVQLAEQQGQLLVQVIHGILGDLRLTSAQQKLVATVVPRHLRAIEGQVG